MENLVKSDGGGGGDVQLAGEDASADGGKPLPVGSTQVDGGSRVVYVAKVRILGRDVMSSEQVIQLDALTRSLKNVCKDCRGCFILLAQSIMSFGSRAPEDMSTAQHLSVTSSGVATTFADATGLVSDFCTLSALEPSSAFSSSL